MFSCFRVSQNAKYNLLYVRGLQLYVTGKLPVYRVFPV